VSTTDYFQDERHSSLREAVAAFAAREVAPEVARMESERRVEHELARRIAAQGWIGVTIPRSYGGMGLGHLAKTLIIEELSKVSAAMGAMVQASQLGVAKVLHFGNEQQKRFWLPRFASGESLPTIAVTEPESGGHVLAMAGSAVPDGDGGYVVNGRKWFVGNSHIGDVHGVVVRTGAGSRGLSAFLVETDRPGFRLGEAGTYAGLHGFSFGEIIFDNCRVPAANRLGDEGQGLDVAYSSSVLYGRPNLTAVALGIHHAVVEETVRFCSDRHLYGKPMTHMPTINLKLGQMQSRLMTARLAAYHAAHQLDSGLPCDAELINAKLLNTEYAMESAQDAMHIHGGRGLQISHSVERYLRDAMHLFPPAGTSDIQRLRLGKVATGTYGPQWSSRLADRTGSMDPVGAIESALEEPETLDPGEILEPGQTLRSGQTLQSGEGDGTADTKAMAALGSPG
jgi:acyl-CoA dehydrogenase